MQLLVGGFSQLNKRHMKFLGSLTVTTLDAAWSINADFQMVEIRIVIFQCADNGKLVRNVGQVPAATSVNLDWTILPSAMYVIIGCLSD